MKQSNRRILGRGLDSLLHVVESEAEVQQVMVESFSTPSPSSSVEHPDSLTPLPLRLKARERLEKLSSRPRHGIRAARHYLDKLRCEDGRISLNLDTSRFDLTGANLLQLKDGVIAKEEQRNKP
jgi:hypothetical protein